MAQDKDMNGVILVKGRFLASIYSLDTLSYTRKFAKISKTATH